MGARCQGAICTGAIGAVAAQARQQHPAGQVDAAVIEGHVGGMEAREHQGRRPPGAIPEGACGHAQPRRPDQQPQHQGHQQQRHR